MKTFISILFIVIVIILVFQNYFTSGEVVGGDWPYLFEETLQEFSLFPPIWQSTFGLGSIRFSPWIDAYLYATVHIFVTQLGIPWDIVQKLSFFFPVILLSCISYFILSKQIFQKVSIVPSFIYVFNTYALMIIGGGQMGVALSYSVAPLTLATFIKLIQQLDSVSKNFKFQISNFKFPIIAGLVLALQVLFDPRIAYITMLSVGLYGVIYGIGRLFRNGGIRNPFRSFVRLTFFVFLIPFGIAAAINTFWWFPVLLMKASFLEGLGPVYTSSDVLPFFSFGLFEQSLSLLHPNWPENIFGKVNFMKPEFLMVPILAYSSLLFISVKRKAQSAKLKLKAQNFENNLAIKQFSNKTILFFVLLGLLGTFLAKGVNPPFGEVYRWLFENIPGFVMFRDPTKWYTLIALSYSALITFSVYSVQEWLKEKIKNKKSKIQSKYKIFDLSYVFLLFTILYLLFLIHPALFGELGGTLQAKRIPQEYRELKDFIHNQPEFFRTFWVPQVQRFGYYSHKHPVLSGQDFFKVSSASAVLSQLRKLEAQSLLRDAAIKYVIVPYDSEGEIFLRDRKYNEVEYKNVVKEIEKISWLKKKDVIGKIVVYELSEPKERLFLVSQNDLTHTLLYTSSDPTNYPVQFEDAEEGDLLILSEHYDPGWVARFGKDTVQTRPYKERFNSFVVPNSGRQVAQIYYQPSIWATVGYIASGATVFLTLGLLLIGRLQSKKVQ